MALATNPLLTAQTAAKAQKASAGSTAKALDPVKDNASSFSSVLSKQASTKPSAVDNSPAKPANAKSSTADNKPDAKDTSAAGSKTVAASGNGLPAKQVNSQSDSGSDQDDDDDDDSTDTAQASKDASVVDASVIDPTVDPSLLVTAPVVEPAPVTPPVAAQPVVDPALLAANAAAVPLPVVPVKTDPVATAPTDNTFDPSTDPLQGLTAVQVALDSKAQQTASNTKTAGDANTASAKQDPNADPTQLLANNLAALGDGKVEKDTTQSGGDKAFSGLIADGLKDVKDASSDTRVDNFAERLAALSQAAQPKVPATAAAPAAPVLSQPLAMNQSGWTEGIVNRVMYLSSQNLKQADIQLEPAELGRLDIRVNMAADQQTQVTFMSAHVGVREALENQMSRLRDSFTQQGMGQVDVNVSDQSRGWQQQAQQQQSDSDGKRSNANGGGNGIAGADAIADGSPVDAATAAANAPLTVVGSSAVDYYA